MIIVFLDKPVVDDYVDAHIYKDLAALSKDVSEGRFDLDTDDSLFIGEMPVLKEYIYKATLVEKKAKK